MSYQRVSYVTMVCVAARFPMILSLMNGFQIRMFAIDVVPHVMEP